MIEFVSKNMLGFNIDEFIYRPAVEQMLATYTIGEERFVRARSVAEEPTHFVMYLVMFSSFVIYYYKFYVKNNTKLYISILIMLTALFTTFSAAGFFVVVASSILTGIFYCLFTKKIRISVKHTAVGFVFLISVIYISVQYRVFDGILHKLLFVDAAAASGRVQRWTTAWELFLEKPIIGWGPGITSILKGTGSTNFYLEVATQVGIIGLIILVLIFLNFFRIIFKIKGSVKYVYLFSLISASIYFVSMSNYWFPWVWGLFAIVGYQYYLQAQRKSEV
ncbi:MAG: O-antigen ligase family protein [Alkaliphilus sp.]